VSVITAEQALAVWREAELIHSAKAVHAALDRMAAALNAHFRQQEVVVLAVMNGALVVAGHLLTRLEFPLQLGYLHATRYRGATRGGELDWIMRPRLEIAARTVLVVDDIYDEGITLKAILDELRRAGAQAVYSAVLVNKIHDRKAAGLAVDFVGLEVEDRYVFGFGMDYKDYLRNAPGIYAVKGL